jgi:hypothetical protein
VFCQNRWEDFFLHFQYIIITIIIYNSSFATSIVYTIVSTRKHFKVEISESCARACVTHVLYTTVRLLRLMWVEQFYSNIIFYDCLHNCMCIWSVWYACRQMFSFSPMRFVQLTHIHAECFECATG